MTDLTSSQDEFDQGITLRADITGILSILFVALLITCAVMSYATAFAGLRGTRLPQDMWRFVSSQ